jgi:hypothetical protein
VQYIHAIYLILTYQEVSYVLPVLEYHFNVHEISPLQPSFCSFHSQSTFSLGNCAPDHAFQPAAIALPPFLL